ncbi:hypothetical protein ACS3UN_03690 [Oscillospiraceae bacterium LTW-04]|nr:hypothetical protein RBH76_06775 [Oscillospiraceae bacterium MB24-C1]
MVPQMDALGAFWQLLQALWTRLQILLEPKNNTYNNHIRIDVVVFLRTRIYGRLWMKRLFQTASNAAIPPPSPLIATILPRNIDVVFKFLYSPAGG